MSVYALAEVLHKFAYEVEALPVNEYMKWMAYYSEKARQQEAEKGNVLAMSPEEAIGALTDD